MSYLGTFDGFTTSRLAIIAAQTGLNLTGNNIANISTTGYTRQVLDQVSLKTGACDRYASVYQLHMGTGVLCTGISQIRDPYLDIRFRTESASVGATDTWLAGLNDIAAVLDEVGKGENDGDGLIMAQISKLRDALNDLNTEAGQEVFDNLARTTASDLCTLFNKYAEKLETLKTNMDTGFQKDLSRVNEILTSIRDLNSEIRKSEIHGDNALEMRDERNRLIDELSQYMKIDVIYDEEDLGGGDKVEKLTIRLASANPEITDTENATLVDGVYAVQFVQPEKLPMVNDDPDQYGDFKYLKYDEATDTYSGTNDPFEAAEGEDNTNYTLALTALADSKDRVMKIHGVEVEPAGVLDDNDLYGSLQSSRELLTEKGEFATADDIAIDEKAASKRGIPFYQMSLDLLARKIAETLNNANQGYAINENGNYITADGTEIQLAGASINKATGLTADQKDALIADGCVKEDGTPDLDRFLEAKDGMFMGGPLFSNLSDGDDTTEITAANISISQSWSTGDVHIVATFTQLFGGDLEHTTQEDNIAHMITLFDQDMLYNPQDLDPNSVSKYLYNGSFRGMLDRMCTDLGDDQRSTNVMLNNYYSAAVELDSSRDGVSGVDLNDESMNMMQYQKALTAAYRLMTVLDEALERLISNTGVAGR